MKFLKKSVEISLEILETIGLLVCFLFASPLGFFRRLDRSFDAILYAQYLIPRGLFAPLLRAQLDLKMGNLLQSGNIQNQIIGILEAELERTDNESVIAGRILLRLYSDLMENYILSGRIEDASLIVIRAHQRLGVQALPCNPSFDVRTAHVVKAGIAAGKLLEDGGLATLMVKPGEAPIVSSEGHHGSRKRKTPLSKLDGSSSDRSAKGKVIPFPVRS